MKTPCLLLIISASILTGCLHNRIQPKTDRMEGDYTTGIHGAITPKLPDSAENRLFEAIGGYGISYIGELVYYGGYLGINGGFNVNWGSLHHFNYVLKIEDDATSWDEAKVFKPAIPETIEYTDEDGEQVVRYICSLSDLFSLPDRVMTNLLFEIKSPEHSSAWTKEELSRLPPRKEN